MIGCPMARKLSSQLLSPVPLHTVQDVKEHTRYSERVGDLCECLRGCFHRLPGVGWN